MESTWLSGGPAAEQRVLPVLGELCQLLGGDWQAATGALFRGGCELAKADPSRLRKNFGFLVEQGLTEAEARGLLAKVPQVNALVWVWGGLSLGEGACWGMGSHRAAARQPTREAAGRCGACPASLHARCALAAQQHPRRPPHSHLHPQPQPRQRRTCVTAVTELTIPPSILTRPQV